MLMEVGFFMRKVLLSYFIDNNSVYYIGTSRPVITPVNKICAGEDYNTFTIYVNNHCGTHIDAPRHFILSGRSIGEYDIMELVFNNPFLFVCEKGSYGIVTVDDFSDVDLSGYDCLLIKTGFGRFRKGDRTKYLTEYPAITSELVRWIRVNYKNIKCIGIDVISISSYDNALMLKDVHLNAFIEDRECGDPLLLVEDMKLDMLNMSDKLCRVIIVPWQVKDIDSAPCTVIADLED